MTASTPSDPWRCSSCRGCFVEKLDGQEDTPWTAEADRDELVINESVREKFLRRSAKNCFFQASESAGAVSGSPTPPDYPPPPPMTIAVDIVETPRMEPADEAWNVRLVEEMR